MALNPDYERRQKIKLLFSQHEAYWNRNILTPVSEKENEKDFWKTQRRTTDKATNIQILDRQLQQYREHTPFAGTPYQFTAATGYINANVAFIGKNPGLAESEKHHFFLGKPGGLLAQMLRESCNGDFYYINLLPFPVSAYKDMEREEYNIFYFFARKRLELVDPRICICLGKNVHQVVTHRFTYQDKRATSLLPGDFTTQVFNQFITMIFPKHQRIDLIACPHPMSLIVVGEEARLSNPELDLKAWNKVHSYILERRNRPNVVVDACKEIVKKQKQVREVEDEKTPEEKQKLLFLERKKQLLKKRAADKKKEEKRKASIIRGQSFLSFVKN